VSYAEGVWLELTHSVRTTPPPHLRNLTHRKLSKRTLQTNLVHWIAKVVHVVANGELTR
jgi:hypothetical protein